VIVYAESNFLLEIALGRENEAGARQILDRAENGAIELAVPVFCLCEPFSTVAYRARKRAQEFRAVQRQLEDLGRGEAHRDLINAVATPLSDVLDVEIRERTQLEDVVGRLLNCANILDLSHAVFIASQGHQATHGLDATDAIVYATVQLDASAGVEEPKVFVTRNSNDFDLEAIRAELDAAGCRLTFSFDDCDA